MRLARVLITMWVGVYALIVAVAWFVVWLVRRPRRLLWAGSSRLTFNMGD